MFSTFISQPPKIHIEGLGDFRYLKDETDEYWEMTSEFSDPGNSIQLDFCAIDGNSDEVSKSAKDAVIELLKDPAILWSLVDDRFLDAAKEDAPEMTKASIKKHFFIKSLNVSNSGFFEVGFHRKGKDIFLELFVREGSVTEIHKDYGCCA